MPGHDKTGPLGAGPLTGRRMGLCADNETSDAGNAYWIPSRFRGRLFQGGGRGYGLGRRPGFGRGVGFQRGIADQLSSDDRSIKEEIDLIKNQLKALENQLSGIVKKDEAE
ncbi:MAG: DUF5320 domain-containing protein [Bacteroidales bacterium]|nr:DUF5320 domain-containing protein [Bacteroidales bacterium]